MTQDASDVRISTFWIVLVILSGIALNACAMVSHARGAERGIASNYGRGDGYAYKKTANGETMNPRAMTAAHRTLPFGTMAQVRNLRNGSTVVVRINDRGPFVRGRVVDLTPAAARAIGCDGLCDVMLTP